MNRFMKKRMIMVTTGTRADYGLLRPLLQRIRDSEKLNLCLIVTGMHLSKNYGLTVNEIKKDGFVVSATIPFLPKSDSLFDATGTLGEGITRFAKIINRFQPDINLILGDRDEMLASALAASHMNIPNAHIHGGDKSGGIDEYNRHAITKISNIHFAASKKSKMRIIRMGEDPKRVFFTGSTAIDEIKAGKISTKAKIKRKYDLDLHGDEIILLYHSVTTQLEHTSKYIKNILFAVNQFNNMVIAIAPNSDPGGRKIFEQLKNNTKNNFHFRLFHTFPREDYLALLKYCGILVGNSSSGIIEGSYFNIPIVNIGIRQQNREESELTINVQNITKRTIQRAIIQALRSMSSKKLNNNTYGNGTASKKIIRVLEQIPLDKKLIQKQITF